MRLQRQKVTMKENLILEALHYDNEMGIVMGFQHQQILNSQVREPRNKSVTKIQGHGSAGCNRVDV